MGKTAHSSALVLNFLFGNTTPSPTPPSTWYISLYNGAPNAATITGSSPTPLNTTRVAIGGWTIANGQATNTSAINFPEAPAGGWSVSHFAVFDGATASANAIVIGAFSTSRVLNQGDVFTIGATRLVITEV